MYLTSLRLSATEDVLQQLGGRDAVALRLYLHENYNLAKIGKLLGVTDERARQIVNAAIQKLESL